MRYVALLRAINVGGRTTTMTELRRIVEAFGVEDVSTYIQTGNVLFTSEKSRRTLGSALERHISKELGYQVDGFVFTSDDLADAVENNPLPTKSTLATHQFVLLFLARKPAPARFDELKSMEDGTYRFALNGSVLYYSYPKSSAGRRRNIPMEKVLGTRGTARTQKVVEKLVELAAS